MFEFILNSAQYGKLVLRNDPIGWDKQLLEIKEDSKYSSLIRSITVKLEFIKEAKQYLTVVYEESGIEAAVTLTINELDPATKRFEFLHEGRVNLATYRITATGVFCNIEELGFVQSFKNNDEAPVNLMSSNTLAGAGMASFESKVREIPMHSKVLIRNFKAVVESEYIIGFEFTTTETNIHAFPGMELVKNQELESFSNYSLEFRSLPEDIFDLGDVEEDGRYEIAFELRYKVLVRSFNQVNEGNTSVKLYMQIGDADPFVIHDPAEGWTQKGPTTLYPEAKTFEGDLYTNTSVEMVLAYNSGPLELKIGDKVKVYYTVKKEDLKQSFWLVMLQDSKIEVKAATRAPGSTAKGVLIYDALERICQHITGAQKPFYSEYFGRISNGYVANGPGSELFVTSGFLLRGFDIEEKGLTMKWKDVYDNLFALFNIRLTVEFIEGIQKIRLEPMSHRYSKNIILQLDYVADLEKTVNLNHFYNEIEAGCTKWENEEVNVLDEVNALRNFTMPITQHKQKLNITNTYITSGYDLEICRRKRMSETTDYKRDNDIYLVQLIDEFGTLVPERDHRFSDFENLIDPPTSYNLALTPARTLRKHGAVIRACLEKYRDSNIRFASGSANYEMKCKGNFEGSAIDEGADVRNDELEDPYYLPEDYTFTAPLHRADIVKLIAEPNGVIAFNVDGKTMKYGYISDVKMDRTEPSEFKLLRANL